MGKTRLFIAAIAALVVGTVALPVAGAQQEPPDGVQIFVVLDVSGSMSDLVFDEDLPAEIVDLQEQIIDLEDQAEAMEGDPEVVALEDQIAVLEEDPAIPAAEEAFNEATAVLEAWIIDNGIADSLMDAHEAVRTQLRDMGCNEFLFANILGSADLDEVAGWIDFACGDQDVSDEDRQALIDLVSFVADPDFQAVNQAQKEAFEAVDTIRATIGINDLQTRLAVLLDGMGYYELREQILDLTADIDEFAAQQGFPTKLELAQLAAHTLLDLSRLDQVAGDVATSLGLAVFSTVAELRHEMTENLDDIAAEIELLEPLDRTNLGGGMAVALDELERERDPERPAAIILLSDGHSNEGMAIPEILQTIPRRANDLDVAICSAGFATTEDEVDADLLEGLAEQTDGEYLFLTRGEELTSFFLACRQGLLGTVVERAAGLAVSEPAEFGRIEVPEGTCELKAVVAFVDISPQVDLINPAGGPQADVDAQSSGNLQVLTVTDPDPGAWVAAVSSPAEDGLFSLVLSTEECPEPPATTTTAAAATTAPATTVAAAPADDGGGGGAGLLVVLVVLVVLGVGGAAVFLFLRKRSTDEE